MIILFHSNKKGLNTVVIPSHAKTCGGTVQIQISRDIRALYNFFFVLT
jgi:hypothetical protein